MGAQVNYSTINYRDQQQFDYFFATAFDKYDRNRDGRIDYNEFQPLVNEMCQIIAQKYGTGPTLDKIDKLGIPWILTEVDILQDKNLLLKQSVK